MMQTKRYFFDLDGTLIDSRLRLYTLFHELVSENFLSFEAYWELKRKRMNQSDLLETCFQYSKEQIRVFKKLWLEKIEEPERLSLDIPFKGITELLMHLSQKHEIYLISARQFPERTRAQLQSFGWLNYFSKILITQQQQSKASLLRSQFSLCATDVLVGDTGEDIETGKALGMETIAVYSGILNKEILIQYNPDQILAHAGALLSA